MCDSALTKADKVIHDQGELIQILEGKGTRLQDQNEELSKALVEMKQVSDKQFEKDVLYGLGGAMVGVIAALLLRK